MPKVSKESATGGGDYGPVVDRNEEVDGYRMASRRSTATRA